MADEKTISPGVYTFHELLDEAGVDFEKAVTVDFGNGPQQDYRRVSVGGLHFDDPRSVLVVPDDGADSLEIRVEGKLEGKLSVDHSKEYRTVRQLADHAIVHGVPKNELAL